MRFPDMRSPWPGVSTFIAVVALALALSGCGGGESNRLSMVEVEPFHSDELRNHPSGPAPKNDHSSRTTPLEQSTEIATSFYSTKLDHYPLDATLTRPVKPEQPVRPEEPDRPVRPERPERPEFDQEAYLVWGQAYLDAYQQQLAAQEADYQHALAEHEVLLNTLEQQYAYALAAYEEHLKWYEDALAQYRMQLTRHEAGECCWEMVEKESEVASRNDVLAMLRENAFSLSVPGDNSRFSVEHTIEGYTSPPIVRIAPGAAPEARAATLKAIDNINAWLPWEKHITIGDDIDPTLLAATEEAHAELIQKRQELLQAEQGASHAVVEAAWAAVDAAQQAFDSLYFARGANVIEAYLEEDLDVGGYGGFGVIGIDKDVNTSVLVIQHELLHALGLIGGRSCYETFGAECNISSFEGPMLYYSHVPVSEFPESEMAYASPYDDTHGLSSIDGEVLQTIYTREGLWGERRAYDDGTEWFVIDDDDISLDKLGPWDDYVIRYGGTFEPTLSTFPNDDAHPIERVGAAFGVDWRNGLARPWAHGLTTYNTFSESDLSGTATWNGELVGFTPGRAAVHGDTSIRVDIAALTGSAAFTTLEHWGDYAPPGYPGTGITWGDGDLYYNIEIASNYIRSNGGDIGYVSGRFVGKEHQGTVGILEHPNLAAGWGASRSQSPQLPKTDTSGNGDTNGGASETSLLDNWQRFEAGNPTLRMSSAQIERALESRDRAASHDLFMGLGSLVCAAGDENCVEEPVVEVEVDQHDDSSFPPDIPFSFSPVLEHNGVSVAEMKARFRFFDEDDGETELAEILGYGGWLDHTFFSVNLGRDCEVGESGCSGTNPVYEDGYVYVQTAGVHSGTTPAGMGSATWTGVMVGMESPEEDSAEYLALVRSGQPDVFLGDARITIDDLADPDVDVSFINVHNVTEGTRHRDMTWEGLAVEDGVFGGGSSEKEYIAGMFTGPQHQEVGGTFGRDGITGAFGAKRQ